MKKWILIIFGLGISRAAWGAEVTTTTATLTVSGTSVTAQVAPARTTGYYRLVYDASLKKVKTLVFSAGITETINGLYCAETYAEIQAYAAANGLTDLPKDPNAEK